MESASALISDFYARSLSGAQPNAAESNGPVGGADFASMAADVLSEIRQTEGIAQSGLTAGADPQSVVMALAETELAIETAVTVRDKIVEAYQELLRMPV
ncbi:MAG: flagellar hook-basal body complex protein FliE [Pseudomonadota bacterium]